MKATVSFFLTSVNFTDYSAAGQTPGDAEERSRERACPGDRRPGRAGPAGRRMAGPLLDRSVPVCALVPTRDHRAEHLRQPGAEVAAGDLREIADVEPSPGNNRAVG